MKSNNSIKFSGTWIETPFAILGLAIVAFLWRLFNFNFSETYYDGCAYVMIARSILEGHLATPYISKGILYHYEPLYPAVTALFSLLIRDIFLAARIANAAAGAMLVWPVSGFASDVFGRRAGFYAGGLVLAHPMLVSLSSNIYSEPLFILFVVFGLWWTWRAVQTGKLQWAVLAGITIGLSFLTRGQGISMLAAILASVILLQLISRKQAWKRACAVVIITSGCYFAVTVPYQLSLLGSTDKRAVTGKFEQEFFKKTSTFGKDDWFIWERSLNRDGTRFLWQDQAEKETVLNFISENKSVYAKRVLRDFLVAMKYVNKRKISPLLLLIVVGVQLVADVSQRRNLDLLLYFSSFGLVVVGSLALGALVMERYISVLVPLFLILGGCGVHKIERFIESIRSEPQIPVWVLRRLPLILLLLCFFAYPLGSLGHYLSWGEKDPDGDHKELAEWINLHLDPDKSEIIMATHPYIPAYSGDLFYMMPIGGIELVSRYARQQQVDYLLAEEKTLQWYGLEPEVQKQWLWGEILPEGISFIDAIAFDGGNNTLVLYKVDSLAENGTASSPVLTGDSPRLPAESVNAGIGSGTTAFPNVILISLDTLRADHLGCYGYERDTSPEIDTLARMGVRFANAISQSPRTGPSHMTMMTSLYPAEHRVHWDYRRDRGIVLSRRWETLAEILKKRGYATAAFVGGGQVAAECGFDRGFSHYEETLEHIGSSDVMRIADWMQERDAESVPFFVFLHTYEIHDPYTPPSPYGTFFDPDYDGWIVGDLDELRGVAEGQDFVNLHRTFWRIPRNTANNDLVDISQFSPRDIQHLVALYDGEIRYTDSMLRQLFEKMREGGMLRNSLVIITADHGEEFAEHGGFLHRFLYRETLTVPLVLSLPRELPQGKVISKPVRLLDLLPTILDMLEIPCPAQARGSSLLPLIDGQRMPDRPVYSEESWYLDRPHHGIRSDRYFLYDKGGTIELFDTRTDPGEQVNLAPELPGVVRELYEKMTAIRDSLSIPDGLEKDETTTLTEERKKQLRTLGYVD